MDSILVPPTTYPVTIDMVMAYGIIDPLDPNDTVTLPRLEQLIATGCTLAETYTNRALSTQTRVCLLSEDRSLPTSPVQSIVSAIGTDLSEIDWPLVEGVDFRITYQTEPAYWEWLITQPNPWKRITVTYVCGFLTATSPPIPQSIIQGICQFVMDNFENPSVGLSSAAYAMFRTAAITRIY